MQFRRMAEQDLEAVLNNERLSYSHPWTEAAFLDCLGGLSECWVVINEDTLIGHLILSHVLDEGHILNICVGKSWQGRGWSHDILGFALKRFRNLNINTVFLEVRASNAIAWHLYLKHGFAEIGRRKGYYPGRAGREDAVVMSRVLGIDTIV